MNNNTATKLLSHSACLKHFQFVPHWNLNYMLLESLYKIWLACWSHAYSYRTKNCWHTLSVLFKNIGDFLDYRHTQPNADIQS